MSLITLFTAPKPFTDPHIATIQRNAIQSWLHLGPDVEVLLVGDETGMAEVAAECGVRQLANVACNEMGTPLVSSIFNLAHKASESPLLAYINADILLLPDFVQTARTMSQQLEQFLFLGQRWDLDIRENLEFVNGWEDSLELDVQCRGRLHPPAGSDYFLFPRGLFIEMPDFAIGRAGWDNWMIFHARQQGWPVVDGTPSVRVIHQDHDYSHLPGGKPHYEQPESWQNESLAGGSSNLYMILDSDLQLSDGQLHPPKLTFVRALRQAEVWLMPPGKERQGHQWWLARRFRRFRRRISGSL